MAIPYAPLATDALSDAYAPPTLEDPGSVAMENLADVVSCKYTFKPTSDEILALIKSQTARQQYRQTFTCIAGLAVGDAVYISANNTATKASSTSADTAQAIGFCAYKPTTTTCYISHFYYKSGLSGLTANALVYLDASGVVNSVSSIARIGMAISTTEALLVAYPIPGSALSGVTSVATGAGLTGGTITSTGTLSQNMLVSAKTGTTYTVVAGDKATLVTQSNASAGAWTLPQATGSFGAGWFFYVENIGVGTLTITPTTSTINGAATLVLPTGRGCMIVSDGTNYLIVSGSKVAIGDVTGMGTGVSTFLTTPSSANLAAALTDETGTGAAVFANTPTLISPVLGTPTSGNLGNCTSFPAASLTGTAAGILTFLATPTSANLASALTDETGTGASVFANTPTLVAPILGTPTSGTLTNCTGLPISTGVSGLGTGVATFLATPTSANLATAVTDETGSGALVFGTSPTLVTPVLGIPTSGDMSNCTNVDNDPLMLRNVGLSVTVASSAITIALKQADGSTNPGSGSAACDIAFRSSTAATGSFTKRQVTGALSLVISNGSSLGFLGAANTQRIWVGLIDNAGTPELCCWNSVLSATNWIKYSDHQLVTSVAEGGAGAADSAQVIYSTSARSAKALRVIGFFEIQSAASFAWSNSPTKVQVMSPGMPRTGDVIQSIKAVLTTAATGTTTVPQDDTVPTNSEGTSFHTQAITMESACNIVESEAQGLFASGTASIYMVMSLFNGSTNLGTTDFYVPSGSSASEYPMFVKCSDMPNSASAQTYAMRCGPTSAATLTVNGAGGSRRYGGSLNTYIRVQEIFA